jgi:transcriptional regulator with XRE-family HTH domain
MSARVRTRLAVEAERRNREQCARVGGELRAGRAAKRLTQQALGDRVGLGRQTIGRAERGLGGGLSLDAWQRIGLAVDRPLAVTLQRATTGETADAGHLAMQELVLRLGRSAGYAARFELPTRPAEPWRSADVGLLDDARRLLVLVECWNTIGDVGAAARSSERKRADAEALAAARWGVAPAGVALVWVVRATARDRALVGRYPEVFAARFPGSSTGWAQALVGGARPPQAAGLVWCDVAATRLFAWRRPSGTTRDRLLA